jgi:RimJ/RimL family protein N-acetyltransferase
VNAYNWRFRRWQHVYVFDPASTEPKHPADLTIERCARVEDIGAAVWDALGDGGKDPSPEDDRAETRANGVFWVARLKNDVVGAAITRRGRHFVRWLLPLEPDDFVLFRVKTLPRYRGQGIASALMRTIALREGNPVGKAYADCRVFNAASIKAIERAGFRRVATVRSMTREEALGPR